MTAESGQGPRAVWSWALYDWAHMGFAVVVMSGFFPVYYTQYWSVGLSRTTATFHLGLINSSASLIILVVAPLLGVLADQTRRFKGLLVAFTVAGAMATVSLVFIPNGGWQVAALVYGIGLLGYLGANVLYDGLLLTVAATARLAQVSSLAYALGYLGGGGLMAFCVILTYRYKAFGLSSSAQALQASFVIAGIWWLLFTLPLLRWVREPVGHPAGSPMISGFRQLVTTVRRVRQHRSAWLFLIAYWLYIDGLNTMTVMAVNYALSIGFQARQLLAALLLVQFVSFPATLAFSWLSNRLPIHRLLFFGLAGYAVATLGAAGMSAAWEFWVVSVLVGLFQGGVQGLSRAWYARLIPAAESGVFFGLYNMFGKFAAIIGPLLMGAVAVALHSERLGILSLMVLLVSGALVLAFVPRPNLHQQPS